MGRFSTRLPTPVFNTPISPFTIPFKRDEQGRFPSLEIILLPGTEVKIKSIHTHPIVSVEIPTYLSSAPLYLDERFLEEKPPAPPLSLPSPQEILATLASLEGIRYFWGGNWPEGIPEILHLYPDLEKLSHPDRADALCQGVDCSGLFYYATNGLIPRNTTQMVHYGINISYKNLSLEELQSHLKPLDWIVWRGHVVSLFSTDVIIESRIGKGVVFSSFKERWKEIVKLTTDQNKELFIRRWHPLQLVQSHSQ